MENYEFMAHTSVYWSSINLHSRVASAKQKIYIQNFESQLISAQTSAVASLSHGAIISPNALDWKFVVFIDIHNKLTDNLFNWIQIDIDLFIFEII